MSEEQVQQQKLHPWRMPQPFCSTTEVMEKMYPLMVYNSLTRTKVRFIPKDPKTISWYQCGPTVYAESHLGHARTYVGLDILKRIFKNFLGYNVLLCQNVTDIDDKIIIRSAERKMPFQELALKYETEFNEDMAALGVEQPDMVTRVSEYVPLIVEYIQTLVTKGVAYESNGSVYFSVANFEAQGHKYGKLMPEQIGNSELLAEGEGALTLNDEKKSATDFVLWKRTKQQVQANGEVVDEPFWESPWGPGRPGWHIECSVMSNFAMQKFGGGSLDVHAGGVDLKFPHHENEIAQSEGYSGCHQWVNYWLHMGHLHIKGLKMSKSLKNFITIREALELYSARQMRFCFLMHKYNAAMDFSDNTMTQAATMDKTFSEFFHNVKAALRKLAAAPEGSPQFVGPKEEALLERSEATKAAVREHLMDDFDTPRAVAALAELVRETNKYLEGVTSVEGGGGGSSSSVVLQGVARYVTSILRTFGLVQDGVDIGFPMGGAEGAGESKAEVLAPLLDILTEFRKKVRIAAIAGDSASVLKLVDALRDEVLPECGVRMEDKGSGPAADTVWKLEDPAVLRKERAQKEAAQKAKEEQKVQAAKLLAEREAQAKIVPAEMFLTAVDAAGKPLYGAYDANGVPTKDASGEDLSKGVLKRLQKEHGKQQEAHNKYLAKKAAATASST